MISGVILARNSQATIVRAIQSLSWCDEVIVIDDNSTDKTPQLARELKARVISHELAEDFASARNQGLDKALGEWVLFLDADEIVPAALAKEIAKELTHPQADAYRFRRDDYFLGTKLSHGETSQVLLLRLARKNVGRWVRPVHERWQVQGTIKTLNHPLHHTPHQSVASFLKKIDTYTTIEAKFRYQDGQRFSWWELLVYPPGKFLRNYVLKQGYKDGFPGLIMAYMMSLHSLIVRIKLYEYTQQNS